MVIEDSRKKQFKDALEHINVMKNKSVVCIEDINYLLDVGSRLLMTFEDMENSRAKWRIRAETAESKLK